MHTTMISETHLSESAHILRLGAAITQSALGVNASKTDPGDTPIIRVADLPKDVGYLQLHEGDFERRTLKSSRALQKATIEPDDVLLVARGGQLRVGIANISMEGAVAVNNLMLLRTNPAVLQGPVLAAWLGSPRGQHALAKISRSSTSMMSLRIADVLELEAPVPTMAVQDYIVDLVFKGSLAYAETLALAELREQLIRTRCAELLGGVA
jgi:hypothetical protein